MMGEKAISEVQKPYPLLRRLFFIASWLAVLSSLYHISAVYLLPLPAKMHPNMHLLMAFTILLIGGAAEAQEVYGEKFRKLGVIPALYTLALAGGVFFFFFLDELGGGGTEGRVGGG